MNHPKQHIQPATAIERQVSPRRGIWRRSFGKAETAILLMLAALPPVALWSPVLLGGGAVPASL